MFFLEFILKSVYRNGLIDYGSGIVKKKNPNSLDLFRTGIFSVTEGFCERRFTNEGTLLVPKGSSYLKFRQTVFIM